MSIGVVVFSIGLVLTMATQLRVGGLPLGPGEALLAAWIYGSWVTLLRRRHVRVAPDLRPFELFFALIVCLLLLSVLYQILRLGTLYDNAFKDTIAYVFTAVLVATFGFLQPSRSYVLGCVRLVAIGMILSLSGLMIASFFTGTIGPIILNNGVRFFGWADNPNQIGMALTPLPFICLFLMGEAKSTVRKIGWVCALALTVWVGIATHSDALRSAWWIGLLLLLLVPVLRKIIGRAHPAYTVANVFAMGLLAMLILASMPAGALLFDSVSEGDEGGHRLHLWTQAVTQVLDSPIVGLGPGAKELHVDFRTFGEAHNSYIDFALTTGLLGSLAVVWLIASLMLRPSLVARPSLWAGFMALQFFSMFHYMFRHPLFWFYIILMAAVAYRDYATEAERPVPSGIRQSTRGVAA